MRAFSIFLCPLLKNLNTHMLLSSWVLIQHLPVSEFKYPYRFSFLKEVAERKDLLGTENHGKKHDKKVAY